MRFQIGALREIFYGRSFKCQLAALPADHSAGQPCVAKLPSSSSATLGFVPSSSGILPRLADINFASYQKHRVVYVSHMNRLLCVCSYDSKGEAWFKSGFCSSPTALTHLAGDACLPQPAPAHQAASCGPATPHMDALGNLNTVDLMSSTALPKVRMPAGCRCNHAANGDFQLAHGICRD